MFQRQTLSNMKCLTLAILPPAIPINKMILTPVLTAHVYEATFEIEHNGTPICVCVCVCVCVLHSDSLQIGFGRNKSETIRLDFMDSQEILPSLFSEILHAPTRNSA